ncbi:MAG: hypothetical protein KME12_07700 [Trichocoleus desertorum ATA4-8-CV12]|nr:hypothetical protein [Trichocoleus desertorum ATA4-8-CV12]
MVAVRNIIKELPDLPPDLATKQSTTKSATKSRSLHKLPTARVVNVAIA